MVPLSPALPRLDEVSRSSRGPSRFDPTDAVASVATRSPVSLALEVLDLARWAPSGDNSQPWRFEIVADDRVRVHAFDTRRHCVYDLEGHASQLSVGAMLETLRIAARARGYEPRVERRPECPVEAPVFDVRLEPSPTHVGDELEPAIRERSVVRKPLELRPLQADHRQRLEAAVGEGFRVVWFESARERRALAWLAVKNARIRLTIPEAYAVHREIIAWDARYSDDRVPDQALGADPLSLRSMRWVMASWERVQMMNRWFGGTLAPRLQLDLLPGLFCAAHFALVAEKAPEGIDDYVDAGAAVQRFWLTATRVGLQLQPQYTPLVFAEYVRRGIEFTSVQPARERAIEVESRLTALLGAKTAPATVFLGRVGYGKPAQARSLRLPLERLLTASPG
jgi:nitroreductase